MEPVEIMASQRSDETLDRNCKVPRPCCGVLFSGRALCWHFPLDPLRLAHRYSKLGSLYFFRKASEAQKGQGPGQGVVAEPGLGWVP